jgi:hypothetical protein
MTPQNPCPKRIFTLYKPLGHRLSHKNRIKHTVVGLLHEAYAQIGDHRIHMLGRCNRYRSCIKAQFSTQSKLDGRHE